MGAAQTASSAPSGRKSLTASRHTKFVLWTPTRSGGHGVAAACMMNCAPSSLQPASGQRHHHASTSAKMCCKAQQKCSTALQRARAAPSPPHPTPLQCPPVPSQLVRTPAVSTRGIHIVHTRAGGHAGMPSHHTPHPTTLLLQSTDTCWITSKLPSQSVCHTTRSQLLPGCRRQGCGCTKAVPE